MEVGSVDRIDTNRVGGVVVVVLVFASRLIPNASADVVVVVSGLDLCHSLCIKIRFG